MLFAASEPGALIVRVQREARGDRTCRAHCHRFRTVAKLTRQFDTTPSCFWYSGRVAGRALRPGRHRFLVRAIDATGNRTRTRRLTFTIEAPHLATQMGVAWQAAVLGRLTVSAVMHPARNRGLLVNWRNPTLTRRTAPWPSTPWSKTLPHERVSDRHEENQLRSERRADDVDGFAYYQQSSPVEIIGQGVGDTVLRLRPAAAGGSSWRAAPDHRCMT